MDGARVTRESAQAAGQILTAMRRGSLADLESGLGRAERLANSPRAWCPHAVDQVERLELLGAIATQMRRSIGRFAQQLTPHIEGIEVQLRLLGHLADSPRAGRCV